MRRIEAHQTNAPKTQARRRAIVTEPQVTALLFVLPALLIFLIFVVWPILQSARYSTYMWNGLGPLRNFVGLDNYWKMFEDRIFWLALRNNAIVVIWSLVTQLPLAIGLAILLTGRIRGASFFRTLYFAPLVLSDVIVGTIWGWIYRPQLGMIDSFLRTIGLEDYTQAWLGNERLSLLSVLVATNWKYLGFYIVIFIAAIQTIPEELYEAAQIDGVSGGQAHRYITLPLLATNIRTTAVLAIVGSLKFFDMIWVLTQGGPSFSSDVLATYMFKQAFKSLDWGYASAIAFTMFAIAAVVATLFIVATRQRQVER